MLRTLAFQRRSLMSLRRRSSRFLVSLGLVTLIAAPCAAQRFSGPARQSMYLGKYPVVQFELKLDDEQAVKVTDIVKGAQAKKLGLFAELRGLPRDERLAKLSEKNAEIDA